ncbi:MAG: M48 family metallopeptidase [Phycisphaerae bacterium]
MFEAIRANERRSLVLITLMGGVLLLLGGVIGAVFDPVAGTFFGIAIAVAVWLVLWATAAWGGDQILLATAGAKELQSADHPRLWNIVEEMTIAAGLPKMPRVFLVDEPTPNAFAVGRRPETAAVAVTSGLLKRLNRDELQGVIAHEIAHLRNRDVRFMTLAAVMMGAIVLLSELFLRGLIRGGGRRGGKGGGAAVLVLLLVALVVAILAPIAAQLLYFACSRRREYLADASGALFTRYPPGLASALERISHQAPRQKKIAKVVAPLYIVNPLQERRSLAALFSTHPPTTERVRILRAMGGAGLAEYERAYKSVHGGGQPVIGSRSLAEAQSVEMRSATPQADGAAAEDPIERAKQVGVLLDHVTKFIPIACACGARLKLPPDYAREAVQCPRCGVEHAVPRAATGAGLDAQPGAAADASHALPLRYERRTTGWESFQCACGQNVQISPKIGLDRLRCTRCRRTILIKPLPGAESAGAAG